MISKPMKNMAPGAFTERGYIKICSPSTQDLKSWINSKGGTGFSKLCSICKPDINKGEDEETTKELDFDDQVTSSLKDSEADRLKRLQNAPRLPTFSTASVIVFDRNPDVVAAVLLHADGVCEECKSPAPFIRRRDNTPYLEVHHRIRLADGGEDSVENALAVCPNCHRRLHFGLNDA